MAKQTVGELIYKIIGDTKGLRASLLKAYTEVKSLGGSINKMSIQSIAKLTALGVSVGALSGVFVDAAKKAIEFESRIGDIQTLIGDDSAGVDKLRKGILELARTVPRSADELGAASYNILSAGITDASDALIVLEASGKLAVAGLGTTTEAVDLTTSAINAFKLDAAQADRVANTVFATVRAGKTTVGELAQSFGNVAAAAQGAGVSFEEVQAATAALTTVGFKTATAQDRLRALFDEMTRSSGKLVEGIKDVGIENVETTIKTEGFKTVLDRLYDSTGQNDIAFKNMFSSVEAGGAALALVNGASEIYNDTLDYMRVNTGDLEKAFNSQADTTANKLAVAQNQMNLLLIDLGTNILPRVNNALSIFLDYLNSAGKKAINQYVYEMEKIGAQTDILNNEIIKVSRGTSQFTQEQVDSAKAANNLVIEEAKLTKVLGLLEDAQNGNFFQRKQALKALKDDNVELSKYATTLERIFLPGNTSDLAIRATKDYSERLKENAKEQEKLGNALEVVLNPSKELFEEFNKLENETVDFSSSLNEAESAAKKAASELESFQSKMVGMIETSKEASDSLKKDFTKILNETNEGLSKIVISAENKIKDLKSRIRKEEDSERREELQKELSSQEDILKAREGFEERKAERLSSIRERLEKSGVSTGDIENLLNIQSLEDKIREEKEIAEMNEFSRFEEQQFKKLEIIVDDIIKRRELENELTNFLLSQDSIRSKSVDEFANNAIEKYRQMASTLRTAISLQNQLNTLRTNPQQFHNGGMVGSSGGEVHAGEYVIPAHMVSRMSGIVSSLESARRNGGIDNSRTINAPITMNNNIEGNADFNSFGKSLAWQLGGL